MYQPSDIPRKTDYKKDRNNKRVAGETRIRRPDDKTIDPENDIHIVDPEDIRSTTSSSGEF